MFFALGWCKGEQAAFDGRGGKSWLEVSAEAEPRASVCFYYRGRRESEGVGKNFRNILDRAPHMLMPVEINSLSEVLRGKDDPQQFRMTDARTTDLNSKRVLIVEGRDTKSGDGIYAILVDADGTGRVIQEIYYQAPKEIYPKYLKEAKSALKSIQWK
jgi:hypothetical protein